MAQPGASQRRYIPWKATTHKMSPPEKDSSAYHQVKAELIGCSKLRTGDADSFDEDGHSHLFHAVELYRNNLVACSRRYNFLFIATRSKVKVYQPSYPSQCISEPLMTLRGPEELPNLRTRGHINLSVPHTVNNMIVADLGKEEVLLVANDNGYVTLWYTKHLVQRQGNMDIWFDVKQSAWGLSEDPTGRWLAATDITGAVILYDLLRGKDTSTSYNGQGWTVTFVPECDFLWVEREEFEALIEKARAESTKAASQGLLSFALDPDSADEDDAQDDWASDVQMTLYAGGDSDEDDEDEDDGSYDEDDDEDLDDIDEDGEMSDEYDEEVEMEFTALEETIIPHSSPEPLNGSYETPVLEITEEAQEVAYGPIPTSLSNSPSINPDGPTPELLPDDEEDPPWENPPPSFIVHSKEFDLKLLAMEDPPADKPVRNRNRPLRKEMLKQLNLLK
ncbi:hypothetical protein ABW20_dc0103798 [Dactylellina cionopaga]|nr:hypothetical protein ABW20_dc0103798 [Dactylellina cionopaga]